MKPLVYRGKISGRGTSPFVIYTGIDRVKLHVEQINAKNIFAINNFLMVDSHLEISFYDLKLLVSSI